MIGMDTATHVAVVTHAACFPEPEKALEEGEQENGQLGWKTTFWCLSTDGYSPWHEERERAVKDSRTTK